MPVNKKEKKVEEETARVTLKITRIYSKVESILVQGNGFRLATKYSLRVINGYC